MVKLKEIKEWDEDKIYQFMCEYLPELCPRNNQTGKDLQMGIKAIQRGKSIIKALSEMAEREVTIDREKLAEIVRKELDKGCMEWTYYGIADAIISALTELLIVKEGNKI